MRSLPSSASTVAPEDRSPNSGQEPPKPGARRKLWFFTALSAIAGVVGASALGDSKPQVATDIRSGSPGFKQSSTGKNVHWQKSALTIYLDDSLAKLGSGTNDAVMQAFGQWIASDPNLPNVTFDTGKTSTEPKQDGKSTVSFGRITQPGHERDVAITITYSDAKTGEILEADMILNSTYAMGVLKARTDYRRDGNTNWKSGSDADMESDDCQARYDAQNVATHEAGHFFGLGEDMVEQKATMFLSIGQCETHKRELQSTDVAAVNTLYADNASAEEKAAGPRACSFVGAPPAGGGWAWALGLGFGLVLVRRRRAR